MKASVLAIGTELTAGQITNKNASWISEKLKRHGVQVSMHLTVPDNHELIRESLSYLSTNSDLIFVTGGLGPTSDDFTRDVIAKWAQKEMVFNEASWSQIQERLISRGFSVRDIQKQQCYFPQDSKILVNAEGTANGFYFEVLRDESMNKIFVLPGPPKEIAAIWTDHIDPWLLEKTLNLNKEITKAWDTIGLGESDVALKIEKVLAVLTTTAKFDIGYRVHLPYVEVKVTFLESEAAQLQTVLQQIDDALASITVVKDLVDIAAIAAVKLQMVDFTVYDYVTNGFLHFRLQPYLKNVSNWSWRQAERAQPPDFFENEENFLALILQEEDKCLVLLECGGQRRQKIFEAPMKSGLMSERRKQYFAEMALNFFISQKGL